MATSLFFFPSLILGGLIFLHCGNKKNGIEIFCVFSCKTMPSFSAKTFVKKTKDQNFGF
jgi:hypothetical protein